MEDKGMITKPRLSFFGWRSAILVLLLMIVMVLPASATVYTINPGDSIQTAINGASSGDTIVLNAGTYRENGLTITAKDLTFRAADGHVPSDTIIDGKSAAPRIFTVTDTSSLTIENLTLRNGRAGNGANGGDTWGDGKPGGAGGNGGALSSGGPVTIISSEITDCLAGNGGHGSDGAWWWSDGGNGGQGGSGGAIYATNMVTLTSTNITGCSAGNGGGAGDTGGFASDGTAGTGGSGGAVYANGAVTLTSSGVTGCSAGTGGTGAINNRGANGGNGGAIYSPYAILTFATITDCSAGTGGLGGPSGRGGDGGWGGGVYSPATVTLTSSTISACTAGAGGHGPESRDGSTGGDGGNGGSGGAMYGTGTVTLVSSLIGGCSAGARGTGEDGSWTDGHHGVGGFAGAVYTTTSVALTGSTIATCHADLNGGAIVAETGSATVDTSTFANCVAGGNGGAVHARIGPVAITDATFTGCSAGAKGGAIYTDYGVTAMSSTFEGCNAPDGGAVYGRGGPLHFCRLVDNDAAGPAVATQGRSFDATLNWWGANSDPSAQVGTGVSCSPWMVLGVNATSPPLTSQDYIITTDLLYDSDGTWHDPALGHVPDGIQVFYAVIPGSGNGSVLPTSAGTAAGISQTTFTSTKAGTATVTATVDSQTVSALIERPVAAFTAEDLSIVRQLQAAVFTDQSISTLPLTYAWDFGDGSTSTEQNPEHVYKKEGLYTVTLAINNSLGHDTIAQENYIFATPPNPLKANFMGENKTGGSPLEVQFTDHSLVSVKIPSYPAINSWLWDFGDGSTSTEQNPEHTYEDAGRYSVTLTVSNSLDNDVKNKDFITVKKDKTVTKKITSGSDPNQVLIQDLIYYIPDNAFDKNPDEKRKVLQNMFEEVGSMIESGKIAKAITKLNDDVKDKIQKWLVDDYVPESPQFMTKTEILETIDEIIARLEAEVPN